MVTQQQPETPAIAVWALRVGGGVAASCGALLSFIALYRLGLENGWPPYAAWGLPVCADTLVATAFIAAMAVGRGHPGSKVAHFVAAVALLITVGCNVLYHALLPATSWSIGHVALVATGATPALVVELIIVMQMYLGDGATLAAQDAATATKSATRATKRHATTRPAVAARPGTPVAPPAATVTPTVVRDERADATATTAATEQEAPTTFHPRSEIDDAILALIARHGIENVTGPMVGEAIGKHRATGDRHLTRVKRALKDGKLTLPESTAVQAPERATVSAS